MITYITPDRQHQPESVFMPSLSMADSNRVQAALEDKARTEANTGAPRFMEWLADTVDIWDVRALVVAMIDADAESIASAERDANNLAARYVTERVQGMSMGEIAEIESQLREDGEID